MTSINKHWPSLPERTHEGAPAPAHTSIQELRRSVLSCLLWEKEFYEGGEKIAERIKRLIPLCKPEDVSRLAIEARSQQHLRHVPLWIVRCMAEGFKDHRLLVGDTLEAVIQRPDELTEFLALYWKEKKQPLSAQVKKGLARAFTKFNAYSLAKYNRDNQVKLRDVMFLTCPKPKDAEQAEVFKKLANKTLEPPDTWEVALSASKGEGKTAIWTRLLEERKLGALALIRNLRNMIEAKVETGLIRQALREMKPDRVLPFRFLAALKYGPMFAGELEDAMLRNLAGRPHLGGETILLVDVSGSMDIALSAKSDLMRADAAAGLAVLARELTSCRIATFSDHCVEVPAIRGFGLVSAIQQSQEHSSTRLGEAVALANSFPHDRLIVITDEQSHTRVPGPRGKGYMINVASNQHGVGYGPWTHIDGWSEAVFDYIIAAEGKNLEL